MKRTKAGRSHQRVRLPKPALHKSRSVKARANGADAAVAEEAEEIVLLIAGQAIRQQVIAESAKSRRKQRRKSVANHGRKAGPNRATIAMRAARSRVTNAP